VVAARRAVVSDEGGRSYLPWVMAALVLVVGGAKLDAARPLVARGLALAIPVVPVVLAVKRVEGGALNVERAATAVGWLTILAGEACVLGGLFHLGPIEGVVPFARIALYVAALAALVVHTLEARSQGKARFAGYVGIAAGFAIYLSNHASPDTFGAVFGALFVGLLLGGGAGLLTGELLSRVFKKPEPNDQA
jgi:hypothetical protein